MLKYLDDSSNKNIRTGNCKILLNNYRRSRSPSRHHVEQILKQSLDDQKIDQTRKARKIESAKTLHIYKIIKFKFSSSLFQRKQI